MALTQPDVYSFFIYVTILCTMCVISVIWADFRREQALKRIYTMVTSLIERTDDNDSFNSDYLPTGLEVEDLISG